MIKMSIRKLVIWITFLAIFAMAARISVDTDTWWHLRAGQWIVENRSVPQTDPFSHTRYGETWQYPGWLVEVPMLWIYQAFGPGGLNLWTAAMVTLAFWFVWRTMSGGVFLRAFVIILAAAASGVYWAARPYMMTFVLSAAFLYLLEEDRKQDCAHSQKSKTWKKKTWWLVPLMMVWANSHGGFIVGFILWGVYFVGSVIDWVLSRLQTEDRGQEIGSGRRRIIILGLVGLLMVLAVCINPSGPVMLLYAFKTVSIDVLRNFIQEWQSPNFHEAQILPFLVMLLVLIGVLGASKKRILLEDYLLLAGFLYLSLTAGRNIALFALVAPIVFTRHLEPLAEEARSRLGIRASTQPLASINRVQSILNWVILGVLVIALGVKLSLIYPLEVNQDHFEETLPVQAVEYLRTEQPEGRLFNAYNWGGYLMWALPEYPVFVDGRTDLYGDELIGEWVQVVQAEAGWQEILQQWDIGVIMIEPYRPIAGKLAAEGWLLHYEDDMAVIYGR